MESVFWDPNGILPIGDHKNSDKYYVHFDLLDENTRETKFKWQDNATVIAYKSALRKLRNLKSGILEPQPCGSDLPPPASQLF